MPAKEWIQRRVQMSQRREKAKGENHAGACGGGRRRQLQSGISGLLCVHSLLDRKRDVVWIGPLSFVTPPASDHCPFPFSQ